MNFSHIKSALQLLKIKARPLPNDPEDRRRLVRDVLDVSYESEGSLAIKRQVISMMQKLLKDHSQESRIRSGFAYSLYYVVVDSSFAFRDRELALDFFKDLSTWFDLDEEVRGLYGRAIENLIRDISSDIPNSRRLLSRIKQLHKEFPHCQAVLEFLSSSVFQLHSHEIRDANRQFENLHEMKELYEQHQGNHEISLDYGIALHNSARSPFLTEDQKISVADWIGPWLAVHKPDDWLIKEASIWQASALSNWEDVPRLRQKIAELAILHVQRLHEYSEVREEFSIGTPNYLYSLRQFGDPEQKLVSTMQKLHAGYPKDEKVEIGWRKTLRAVALAPTGSLSMTRNEALQLLRESAASGPESSEALFQLARSLAELAERLDLDEAERSRYVAESREITEKNSRKTDVQSASAYAQVELFKYSLEKGKPDDRYLDKLRQLSPGQPSDSEIHAALAEALMAGCGYVSNQKYASERFEELKNLQKKFPKNDFILEMLAIAYDNAYKSPFEGMDQRKVHFDLESLAKKYPKDVYIARALTNVFSSGFFGSLDKKVLRSLYFSDLKDIAKKFPDSREIEEQYASCLLVASILAKAPWTKRRLLAEAENRDLDRVLDEYPVLAPLLSHARAFTTLTPEEVRDLMEETEPS